MRTTKRPWAILLAMWIGFPAAAAHAADMIELDDVQLDQVTAGASEIDATEELLTFAVTKTTASGRTVTADGSFRLVEALDPATVGNLILSGQSQSNLRALININAVNSEINLLLNLNISIDSTVGTLNQFNLNGVLPVAALPTP